MFKDGFAQGQVKTFIGKSQTCKVLIKCALSKFTRLSFRIKLGQYEILFFQTVRQDPVRGGQVALYLHIIIKIFQASPAFCKALHYHLSDSTLFLPIDPQ